MNESFWLTGRRSAALVLGLLAAGCGRELELPAIAGPTVGELDVSPARARAGIPVSIYFVVDPPTAAEPTVDLGGSLAAKVAGPGARGDYLFRYEVTGDEPDGRPVAIRVDPGAGGTGAAAASVIFDFQPPDLDALRSSVEVAGSSAPVSLFVHATEELAAMSVELQGREVPCFSTASSAEWLCLYLPSGEELPGPQSFVFRLEDLAGNRAELERAGDVVLDFACELAPDLLWLRRAPGPSATFDAAAGALEPGAVAILSTDPGGSELVGTASAAADGSVTDLALPGDPAAIFVTVTDPAGNGCAPVQARTAYTADLRGKLRGLSSPNPSSLRAATGSIQTPPLDELRFEPELSAEDYLAVTALDGAAAVVEAPALPASSAPRWEQLGLALNPGLRTGAPLVLDTTSGKLLLFGGAAPSGALLDDSWEWDGGRWLPRGSAVRPPARQGHAVAHDEARGVTVLFGGAGEGGLLGDTWEWDGATWSSRGGPGPSPREGAAMAFDPIRGTTILLGGAAAGAALDEAWEWDGAIWTRLQGALPPARAYHALATDPGRGVVVLFGGFNGVPLDDLWEWEGSGWTERTPAVRPEARWRHPLAHDRARGVTVLFGGWDADDRTLVDSWEWDGSAFRELSPAVAPRPRVGHGLAYDPGADRPGVTTFGGVDTTGAGAALADTWSFDGDSWEQLGLDAAPPARDGHTLTHDPAGGMLLFGGRLASGLAADTWRFRLGAWTPVAGPGPGPSPRYGHAAFPGQGELVLFGGYSRFETFSDTWGFSEGWSRLSPAASPPARHLHAIASAGPGEALLFGGIAAGGGALGDTWLWDGSGWAEDPRPGPGARAGHALAFDEARGSYVLFGGEGAVGERLDDSWEWRDGWREIVQARRPPEPRAGHALAHDRALGKVLLFGGEGTAGPLADLWEWDGSGWWQRHPASNPTPRRRHALAHDPEAGASVLFGGSTGAAPASDGWALTLPATYPMALASLDASAMAPDRSATARISVAAAGNGAIEGAVTGAGGLRLFLWDQAAARWSFAGGGDGELSVELRGDELVRFLPGGIAELLVVPAHGASAAGGAFLALDRVELVVTR